VKRASCTFDVSIFPATKAANIQSKMKIINQSLLILQSSGLVIDTRLRIIYGKYSHILTIVIKGVMCKKNLFQIEINSLYDFGVIAEAEPGFGR